MADLKGRILTCILVSLSLTLTLARPLEDGEEELELRMPDVQPKVKDTYLCFPMKMGDTKYLTGFVPHANMSTAHHMLLYGCEEPGESDKTWNCGEMSAPIPDFEMGPVCASGAKIIYAWGMDAPELRLPADVGFKVGEESDIPWIVLQVHYKDVHRFLPPENAKDHSGVTLIHTAQPQPNRAGVYLLGTNGELPAHTTVYMETACSYDYNFDIIPFAYRTHAHTHGKVVSGYRVRDGVWEEIGRKDPQKPQMFYNITNPGMQIRSGDYMAARCTMVSDEDRVVKIGSTQNDEMCNFYVMYYVKGQQQMEESYCFSPGPPHWHWSDMPEIHPENAPVEASVIPGESSPIESTEVQAPKVQAPAEENEGEEANEDLSVEDYMRLLLLLDKLNVQNSPQYDTNSVYDEYPEVAQREYEVPRYAFDEGRPQ
ncbi:hypothetical protein CAPTEDRAFT_156752 [Capitella teleta]|uniref:peptidylglycine monooxygenase n=1 Tax=Capitella teleta TaxID=283909 RepID=R7UVI8_CAPTE|nr:hypothetical protein CAPTEDRAFT_156752 [Capitella teleta]|eukprot:ELU10262.1 hypothetical protein CAPTEDRAFT_156752 [Capitella teleta]